jgi:hypothetical protein
VNWPGTEEMRKRGLNGLLTGKSDPPMSKSGRGRTYYAPAFIFLRNFGGFRAVLLIPVPSRPSGIRTRGGNDRRCVHLVKCAGGHDAPEIGDSSWRFAVTDSGKWIPVDGARLTVYGTRTGVRGRGG